MKKRFHLILLSIAILSMVSCIATRQQSTQEKIVGHYKYIHSWDYNAPDGVGRMHCDEAGTLDFLPDGTYVDRAIQNHRHILPDSTQQLYRMDYYCEGEWKVEDDKFLFSEHSENFRLKLTADNDEGASPEYAEKIAQQSTPNSKRWFTFDIERLDNEWFIWSYTDKKGNKTLWSMERTHKRPRR